MALDLLTFWRYKKKEDNLWRPYVGAAPNQYIDNLPGWIKRQDLEAAVVDIAPFVAGVGGLVHLRQATEFGLTAHASIFRNPKTLLAMHRSVLLITPVVLGCHALGVDYRNAIPRWAHERERRRDEEEVRMHVDVGMYLGAACWLARMYGFKAGRRYWAPLDVLVGGALADVMHREYLRAHGL